MLIFRITPENLETYRLPLLNFAAVHGDRRITSAALAWLRDIRSDQLAEKGTEIVAALIRGNLVALSCVADYGKTAAFIVVHPALRGQGIGKRLISLHLRRLGRYRCAVAADNQASLSMCRGCGMKPVWFRNNGFGQRIIVLEGESAWPAPHLGL